MLDFCNSLLDMLVYVFESTVSSDNVIVSLPIIFIILSILFLIFRKVVGLR